MEAVTEKVIGSSQQRGDREYRRYQARLDTSAWPRQVLLVDDAPLVRQAIGETLRSIGIVVLEANSPIDALRLFTDYPTCIDLLISDIEMPGMSGWTLVSRIVSRTDDLQVLYISGGIDAEEWQNHPDRVDGSHFLAKPFTFDCLEATLDVMAESRNHKADHKRARIPHYLKSFLVVALSMASISAFAAGPCAGKVTTPTPAQRTMYARSISSNFSKQQSPSTVEIEKILTLHNWTAIWASPKDMEQGVFIYSQEKTGLSFHDVWGGYATPSEKPEVLRWIKKLSSSVPDDFANCLADTITGAQ
jgi:CheY-like chemotaxis protein